MPIRVIRIRLIIPPILIIRTIPIIIRTTPIIRTTLLISAQFHFTIVTVPADFRDTTLVTLPAGFRDTVRM
jgi:hypothetical protein